MLKTIEILSENPDTKIMNKRALNYFLHFQSMLVKEIESPFPDQMASLEEMNFDFQYHQDHELETMQKLNYLAQMEFWKEYV